VASFAGAVRLAMATAGVVSPAKKPTEAEQSQRRQKVS